MKAVALGNADGIMGPRPKEDVAPASPHKGAGKREGVRDTVSVSSTAQQADVWCEKIKFLPSVRDPETVRDQIGVGAYRPDSYAVAERLVFEHMRPSGD